MGKQWLNHYHLDLILLPVTEGVTVPSVATFASGFYTREHTDFYAGSLYEWCHDV